MSDISPTALTYLRGFESEHETEALEGALPRAQNSPQRCPYGLYAEQLSGSAFTAPRARNLRSWLYRIRPSVKHMGHFTHDPCCSPDWLSEAPRPNALSLGQLRWGPPELPSSAEEVTFLSGVKTMTVGGGVTAQSGLSTHIYTANRSMGHSLMMNADGELMILPQLGRLLLRTELGHLEVSPGQLAVIPRGVLFGVDLLDDVARGYLCENYGAPFSLPELGPIGANGSASPRHFEYPTARFEDQDAPHHVTSKWGGAFYVTRLKHSPLDVVAWHGNYGPYRYDLSLFAPMGSISVDHPDPSIFTVLTSPSAVEGVANIDFVIFSDRWLVAEHSFRPPWYHRNLMSEFMGLIYGQYDAKEEGFVPGGASLHNQMLPHGPDASGFEKASQATLTPQKLGGTLAFMWESRAPQHLSRYATEHPARHLNYSECWSALKKRFNGSKEGDWS